MNEWGDLPTETFDALARSIARLPQTPRNLPSTPLAPPTIDLAEFDRLPLAGRTAELDQLWQLWKLTQQGAAQAIVVEGVAGIGKTRLLHELSARVRLRSHTALLWGIANSDTEHRPFGLLRDALIRALPHVQAVLQQACTALDDRAWSLLHCLPELRQLLPERPVIDLPALDPGSEAERRQAAVISLIDALSAMQPLLLILENAHQSDDETLALIEALATGNRRLLTVVSRRPDPAARSRMPVIALKPLDDNDMRDLLQRALNSRVEPQSAEQLLSVSSGTPLFLREVLRAVVARDGLSWSMTRGWFLRLQQMTLPDPLVDLLAQRLQPVSLMARTFAHVLAVLERPAHEHLLAQLFPNEDQRLAAQAELLAHQVLVERDQYVRFDHDWLREQIVATLPTVERIKLHQCVLAALQQVGSDAAERMIHAAGAQVWPVALENALVVVEQALARGQQRIVWQAIAIAEQALHKLDRSPQGSVEHWRVLLLKEMALRLDGRGSAWTAVLAELQAFADASAQPAWQAEARLRAGQALREQGQHAAAEHVLRAAIPFAQQSNNAAAEASIRATLASVLDDMGSVGAALEESRAAVAAAMDSGDDVLHVRTVVTQAYMEMRAGNTMLADTLVTPLLRLPWLPQQPMLAIRLTRQLAIIKLAGRAYDVGIQLLRESVQLAQQHGDVHGRLLCQTSLTYELIRFGVYDEARLLGEATIALARHLDARLQLSALLNMVAGLHLYSGDSDIAEALAEESVQLAQAIGAPEYLAASLGTRARIALSRGQTRAAHAVIERAVQLLEGLPHPTVLISQIAAQVLLVDHDYVGARQMAQRSLQEVREHGLTGAEAASVLWEAAAVLAAIDGHAAARTHQERAYALFADQLADLQAPTLRHALIQATPSHRAIAAWGSQGPRRIMHLPRSNAPLGRPLYDDEYVPVVWTLHRSGDPTAPKQRRQRQIERLIDQTLAQGAVASVEAIAAALAVSPRTILRDLKELRQQGVMLDTRGRSGDATSFSDQACHDMSSVSM